MGGESEDTKGVSFATHCQASRRDREFQNSLPIRGESEDTKGVSFATHCQASRRDREFQNSLPMGGESEDSKGVPFATHCQASHRLAVPGQPALLQGQSSGLRHRPAFTGFIRM